MDLDDHLVDRARRGDPDALEDVYRLLAPRVLGYLRSRRADDPEELANDVFIDLFRRLSRLEGGASGLTALTLRIAHSRYVDDVRRRARRPRFVEYEPDADLRSEQSAEATAMAGLSGEEVQRLIASLPPDYAATLSMRVVSGLSLAETASALDRSVGAVKQLQRRALEALRHALEQEGVDRGQE